MARWIARLAQRSPYRLASIVLVLLAFVVPDVTGWLGAPFWLALLIGLPAYTLLLVITYKRLRDAWLSGGWILLMLITVHLGPAWRPSPDIALYLGDIVNLIPILLAWIVPRRAGNNPGPA